MAEESIKWTEQQLRAIRRRGSDVLVSASAGTGKTAVLSGRCIDVVSDKNACPDISSIVVLTFTEAAAEQMRTRIASQLRHAYLQTGKPHLYRQLLLLQGAEISTIHSFCKRLITEHFYKLGLDPTFRVIDEDEAMLLKALALEKTINWAWENIEPTDALEQLFSRRDLRTTDGFAGKIIAVSNLLEGVVSREYWYTKAQTLAASAEPANSPLGKEQADFITNRLSKALEVLSCAKSLCEKHDDEKWAADCETKFIAPVADCLASAQSADWIKCADQIGEFAKVRVYKPKAAPGQVADFVQRITKQAIASIKTLSALALVNPDYLDRVGMSASLQTTLLVRLVEKFDQLYVRAKSALNSLDFADLERYALRLLAENNADADELSPSATALALRKRYKYIFVDEYQDINAVQQAILELLTGGYVFGVGDVKQSIYAWRGAQPKIFLEQLERTSTKAGDPPAGLRVDLNANFRSVPGLLDFVNAVFERIMTGPLCGISYDDAARLRPAPQANCEAAKQPPDKPNVEFHILDQQQRDADTHNEPNGGSDEHDTGSVMSSRRRQAAVIARRIREMVGADTAQAEFQIYDKAQDGFRDVEYRDIVVLMRSPAKRANDYVELFRLAGIPVSCDAVAGYFEATEITDMLCLLKVLDNPERDIELAAVLRSPLFSITDTELAKIRLESARDGHVSFYEAVRRYRSDGADANLAGKIRAALHQIDRWRTLARRGSLADLIWQVYRPTGYMSFVQALPNGQARKANLLRLHDRAIQFEGFAGSGGIASLARFVEFIEKLQQLGQDWTPAEPDSSAVNAVRILSVHKSKGLEFPVVFLAELNSHFNLRDVYSECLADTEHTIGLQIIDPATNSRLSSLAHQVIAENKRTTALAEEMRILYVAMTRARERLVLTASAKSKRCLEIISDAVLLGRGPVADWQLHRCHTAVEWLLYALGDRRMLHQAFDSSLADEAQDDNLFALKIHKQDELQQLNDYVTHLKQSRLRQSLQPGRKRRATAADRERLARLKGSLTRRYQFGDAPILPAKQSVTQITHRSDEYAKFDYSRALERRPQVVLPTEAKVAAGVEARLIGIAAHLVIAGLDLQQAVTSEAVQQIRTQLVAEAAITQAVADRVNVESIVAFFKSDLGKLALDNRNNLWREWPFTFALPASEWQDEEPVQVASTGLREAIVVQGIIDLLVKTPSGLVVIDFKTDHVSGDEILNRAESYRRQLQLYGRAASAILNEKLLSRWLYFLHPRCAIEV